VAKRVALLLEDEALIAMDVSDLLASEGYAPAVAVSCADAQAWLDTNPAPDIALIDVHLADGPCDRIAERLREMGVPTVIHSGDMRTDQPKTGPFSSGIWIAKPSSTDALREALRLAVSAPARITPRSRVDPSA